MLSKIPEEEYTEQKERKERTVLGVSYVAGQLAFSS